MFSDGQNEGISVDSKITILEINGLNLPSDNRNVDLTSDEKKSLTIMYALGYYCTKFGKQDRTIETIEFLMKHGSLTLLRLENKFSSG